LTHPTLPLGEYSRGDMYENIYVCPQCNWEGNTQESHNEHTRRCYGEA